MIKPLFGVKDEEWVTMVGRFILNMGAIEAATRLLIARITGTGNDPALNGDLPSRIGFIRRRFPQADRARHSWAMNVFDVALKLSCFRNIPAHSSLAITEAADGTYGIQGILNLTPKDSTKAAELVSLEEVKGRVNESAAIARGLLDMQQDISHGG